MNAEQARRAIDARVNGVWDDPALVAFGPLSDTAGDLVRIKCAFLEACGFQVGTRDYRINIDFAGRFMVCEEPPDDCSHLPTRDGRDGPWAIVGDDLSALITHAYDVWEDYGE